MYFWVLIIFVQSMYRSSYINEHPSLELGFCIPILTRVLIFEHIDQEVYVILTFLLPSLYPCAFSDSSSEGGINNTPHTKGSSTSVGRVHTTEERG